MKETKRIILSIFVMLIVTLSCNFNLAFSTEDKLSNCYYYYDTQEYSSAESACMSALSAVQKSGSKVDEAAVLGVLGQIYFHRYDMEKAMSYYNSSLEISREIKDYKDESTTLHNIGYLYHATNQLELAREYYLLSLEACRKLNDPSCEQFLLLTIGSLNRDTLNYSDALLYYKDALEVQKRMEDFQIAQATSRTIGDMYYRQGDYPNALIYFQEALFYRRELGDKSLEALSLNDIGEVYIDQYELESALEVFNDALEIQRAIGDTDNIGRTLNNIGETYNYGENFEKAMVFYNESLNTNKQAGNINGQAATLNNIGTAYLRINNTKLAIFYLNQALETWSGTSLKYGVARSLINLGKAYTAINEYKNAFDSYSKAISIFKEIGDAGGLSSSLSNLAQLSMLNGEIDQSLSYSQEALQIQQEIGDPTGEITSLNNIAIVYIYKKDYQKSLNYATSALNKSRELKYGSGEAYALKLLARVYRSMGDEDKALELILESIAISESLFSSANLDLIRINQVQEVAPDYALAISLLLKQGKFEQSFEYSERSKAQTLLNLLGNPQFNKGKIKNSELSKKEIELRNDITKLQNQLTKELGRPMNKRDLKLIQDIETSIDVQKKEYQDLLVQLQIVDSNFVLVSNVAPLKLNDVKQMLAEQPVNTVLISYFVTYNEIYIFIVTEAGLHIETVPYYYLDLQNDVENLKSQMVKNPLLADAWKGPSSKLYQALIVPVVNSLPDKAGEKETRIGIVAHGVLNYLPIGLLYDGGDILADNYTLFYAPSVSTLKFMLTKPDAINDNVFIMANPEAENAIYLYFAEEEAKAISDIFGVKPFLGNQASEEVFKNEAGKYSIIHIAAHSTLDSENPLFSALLLQPTSKEDGRLEMYEISQLQLQNSSLVVLSACDTHLGNITVGNEILGLELSFFRAGATSLVTTLWSIDDRTTSEFMKIFYKNIYDGIPQAEALNDAQIKMKEKYPNPFYWAGFILVGDPGGKIPN